MTGCLQGGKEVNKIAQRSSRTTPATESRFVWYPIPDTEEHRCAVFTRGLGVSVCQHHVSRNSFNSGFQKQK